MDSVVGSVSLCPASIASHPRLPQAYGGGLNGVVVRPSIRHGKAPARVTCRILPPGNHYVESTRIFNNPAFSRSHDVAAHIGWLPGPLKGFFGVKDEENEKVVDEQPKEGTVEEEVKEKEDVAEEPEVPPEEVPVVIIGAGLAGLRAALVLSSSSVPFVLLEASDGVGGRVRTDVKDGFLLDRGFQIFLSAYPEAEQVLEYDALDLKPFYSGALVRCDDGQFHRVADPFRHPLDSLSTLFNPVGSVIDKLLVGALRLRVVAAPSASSLLAEPETTILQALKRQGFTAAMIDRFFRPFLGGIFFDRELSTTSRLLNFVTRMLALAPNTIPSRGIGAIPQQLADRLPPSSIRLNSAVTSLSPYSPSTSSSQTSESNDTSSPSGTLLTLSDGSRILATSAVILATEQPAVSRLLQSQDNANAPVAPNSDSNEGAVDGGEQLDPPRGTPRSTVCIYYAADAPPVNEPILLLNGTSTGRVNNMCVPSVVSPSYAPAGQSLISVSLVGMHQDMPDNATLSEAVRAELAGWFGDDMVSGWRVLEVYRIPFAQPDQRPTTDFSCEGAGEAVSVGGPVYVCGDHRASATFDGALASGREVGEAVVRRVKGDE